MTQNKDKRRSEFENRLYPQLLLGWFNDEVDPDASFPPRGLRNSRWRRKIAEYHQKAVLTPISNAVPFLMDEPAEEFEHTAIDISEMRIAPPSSLFWCEFRRDSYQAGVLCETVAKSDTTWQTKGFEAFEYRHALCMTMFWQFRGKPIQWLGRTKVFLLDDGGQILGKNSAKQFELANEKYFTQTVPDGGYLTESQEADRFYEHIANVTAFGLGLMSSNSGPTFKLESTCKIAASASKRLGRHLVYKVCRLKTHGIKLKYINSRETGEERPLHGVRGHFKAFTEDCPLFGKWVGRYYWRSHQRGDEALGEVVKEYRVELGGGT